MTDWLEWLPSTLPDPVIWGVVLVVAAWTVWKQVRPELPVERAYRLHARRQELLKQYYEIEGLKKQHKLPPHPTLDVPIDIPGLVGAKDLGASDEQEPVVAASLVGRLTRRLGASMPLLPAGFRRLVGGMVERYTRLPRTGLDVFWGVAGGATATLVPTLSAGRGAGMSALDLTFSAVAVVMVSVVSGLVARRVRLSSSLAALAVGFITAGLLVVALTRIPESMLGLPSDFELVAQVLEAEMNASYGHPPLNECLHIEDVDSELRYRSSDLGRVAVFVSVTLRGRNECGEVEDPRGVSIEVGRGGTIRVQDGVTGLPYASASAGAGTWEMVAHQDSVGPAVIVVHVRPHLQDGGEFSFVLESDYLRTETAMGSVFMAPRDFGEVQIPNYRVSIERDGPIGEHLFFSVFSMAPTRPRDVPGFLEVDRPSPNRLVITSTRSLSEPVAVYYSHDVLTPRQRSVIENTLSVLMDQRHG